MTFHRLNSIVHLGRDTKLNSFVFDHDCRIRHGCLSPHTKKWIDSIESVQRRAARFVNNDYSRYSSVSSMLTDLTWPSLQSRRRICDLGMFYEIHRGQINISLPYDLTSVPAYGRTRASHDLKIRLPSSSVDTYKHSFYVR